ncbi:6094_t:CDS:2 [Funneliformis caledonium]|uniref:6094_t:CDS:1 n=1 Tax=Funneliformis caledonium TaxID=1117310 RepID=A0A9N9G946_9GLOM|nr:6094_t:CDS:2 [Funneliformis caledonium]
MSHKEKQENQQSSLEPDDDVEMLDYDPSDPSGSNSQSFYEDNKRQNEGWINGKETMERFIRETQYQTFYELKWINYNRLKDVVYDESKGYYVALLIDENIELGQNNNIKVGLQCINDEKLSEVLSQIKNYLRIRNNVVRLFGFSLNPESSEYILVMEDGKGLGQYLKENKLDLNKKYKMMKEIVIGLKNIHDTNISLGYFNSNNILIDDFNNARISIFTNFRQGSKIVYVAPEILGDNKVSQTSNIYSLGMVLYNIIFEKEPFYEFPRSINNEDRPLFIRDIPPLLKELLTKCWNTVPSDRPTINEVVDFFSDGFLFDFDPSHIKQIVNRVVSSEQTSNILEQATSSENFHNTRYNETPEQDYNYQEIDKSFQNGIIFDPNKHNNNIFSENSISIYRSLPQNYFNNEFSNGPVNFSKPRDRLNHQDDGFKVTAINEFVDDEFNKIDKSQITNIRKFENCQSNIRSATMLNFWTKACRKSNIIECLGIFEDEDCNAFLIIPFALEGNLRSYLKNREFSLKKKVGIAINIADGIKYLHIKDIIHENLHPKNILMFEGMAQISDLPLPYEKNKSVFFYQQFFDNIGYIDPSSLLNEDFEKNKSMDIYSFGSLLWEILSGKIPYSKNKDEGILKLVRKIKEDGYREHKIINAPVKYIELYESCWDGKSSNRPTIEMVYDKLLHIL